MKDKVLGLLLAAALLKSLLFMVLVPPWLGNDEPNHFAYVWVMAGKADAADAEAQILRSLDRNDYWRLAEMPAPAEAPTSFAQTFLARHSEDFIGTRSPLYYFIASLPLRLFSPETVEGGLYLARFMSVLMSLGLVALAYRTAAALCRGGFVPLLAGVIAAFHPQLSYLSAMVNSDVLMMLLFGVFFHYTAVMVKERRTENADIVMMLLLIGVSLLVKKPAVILFPAALTAIVFAASGARAAIRAVAVLLSLSAVMFLALEFAVAESVIRLADRVGLSLGYSFAGPGELGALPLSLWVRGFGIMFVTAWFTVGQMVHKQSFGFYLLYAAISAALFAGAIIGVRRGGDPASRSMLYALCIVILVMAMTVLTFFSPQHIHLVSGRYLFYAAVPASVLAAWGGMRLLSALGMERFRAVLVYLFFALNLIALFAYVGPAYRG